MKIMMLISVIALGFLIAGVMKNGVPWDKKPKVKDAPKSEQTKPEQKKESPSRKKEVGITGVLVADGKTLVTIPGRYDFLREGDFYEGRRVMKINEGGAVLGEGADAEIVIFALAPAPNEVLTNPSASIAQILEK